MAQKGEVVLVRCAAARASRREWICGLLWWCEGRVAGAGGAGRPWGASTGQTHMTQASGRYACVCVRAGTYAQFSRGVRGEGHEGRRPRVYWRVRVRGARRRRGPKAGKSLSASRDEVCKKLGLGLGLATTRLQRNLEATLDVQGGYRAMCGRSGCESASVAGGRVNFLPHSLPRPYRCVFFRSLSFSLLQLLKVLGALWWV